MCCLGTGSDWASGTLRSEQPITAAAANRAQGSARGTRRCRAEAQHPLYPHPGSSPGAEEQCNSPHQPEAHFTTHQAVLQSQAGQAAQLLRKRQPSPKHTVAPQRTGAFTPTQAVLKIQAGQAAQVPQKGGAPLQHLARAAAARQLKAAQARAHHALRSGVGAAGSAQRLRRMCRYSSAPLLLHRTLAGPGGA